jgi:hypothetical protein
MSLDRRQRVAASAVAVAVIAPVALWFRRLVSCYGLDGAVRYVWEGSPYPLRVRERMEALDDAQDAVDDLDRSLLVSLERALAIALQVEEAALPLAESSENSLSRTVREWEVLVFREVGTDLRGALAGLSDRLDRLAAQVDAVPSGSDGAVRARRKGLARTIVGLMRRADRLLEFFASWAEAVKVNQLPEE